MPEDGPLTGGNLSSVTRHGEYVHRSAGPWTPTVHRLLNHLRASGLTWVPRPIAFDPAAGQETLSFIPGRVPHDPMPAWAWDDAVVVAAARHLLALHDATAGYRDPEAHWPLPTHNPQQVICHNDFVPYNMVFDAGHRLVGVIDWDTASPGPRVWDLAYLAYRVVPLSAPGNPDGLDSPIAQRRRRLRVLCHAYGAGQTPASVVAAAIPRLEELASFTAERAAAGADHLAAHVPVYRDAVAWLTGAAEQLTAPSTS